MVAHEAIGEDAVAGEVFIHAHEGAEFFFLVGAEGEAAVYDAGDAVVDGGFCGGGGLDGRGELERGLGLGGDGRVRRDGRARVEWGRGVWVDDPTGAAHGGEGGWEGGRGASFYLIYLLERKQSGFGVEMARGWREGGG